MRILYVTAKGGIHDYRFLSKLSEEKEVLLLHYSAGELIDEIKALKKLKIISKKPVFGSFPLAGEYLHFKKIVREFRPDIIHTGYVWQVGILASMLNFHPHLSMVWGSDVLIEPDKNYFIKRIVRKVMHQCDHIQCDAMFVKNKIISDYNVPAEKVTVFPWGIELASFKKLDRSVCRQKLKIDAEKFVVIFNRYLEPVYGIKYLLEGFREFCSGKNDAVLLIVSEGSLRNEAAKFISDNELGSKIILAGSVPNSELPVFLNASDVYISSSLSDGTSLSLLEAMACGTGIIVTDVPAIKEWISGENGCVVKRESSGELCAALNLYYNNRDLIHKHGNLNTVLVSEKADWDKNYLKLVEIYERITAKKRLA